MEMFTVQQVYSAYRRLKSYFYYDNTNLFMRLKIAEFEEDVVDKISNSKDSDSYVQTLESKFKSIADCLNELMEAFVTSEFQDINTFEEEQLLALFESKRFGSYFKDITCYPVPKDFASDDENERKSYHFITNKISKVDIELEKCNYMIDAPIEIHIISELWVEFVGAKLSRYFKKYNYANQLNVSEGDETKIKNSIMLFKPYFIGYQKWRDEALDEAKRLLEKGNDVTILSLDIKRYYYSARINMQDINNELSKSENEQEDAQQVRFLNVLLQLIHSCYQKRVERYLDDDCKSNEQDEQKRRYVLPVGLVSSALLANYYLYKFDRHVVEAIAPSFYGRYVDDLIFVFKNRPVEETSSVPTADSNGCNPVDNFIIRYFCSSGVLVRMESGKNGNKEDSENISYAVNISGKSIDETQRKQIAEKNFDVSSLGHLRIQMKKAILEYFDHQESHAAIDIFMRNLSKNRSEFRFLPNEEIINEEFDNEAYQLLYKDSVNKIRNMQEFKQDKYGAAKYLAKQIFLSKLKDNEQSAEFKKMKKLVAQQLLVFFKGKNALSMYVLWERVASYFVLNQDSESLARFYIHIFGAIDKLTWTGCQKQENQDVKEAVQEREQIEIRLKMHDILNLAIAMPLALNPSFMLDRIISDDRSLIKKYAHKFRRSNMFRINYVGLLGINLTSALLDDKIDLTRDDISYFIKQAQEEQKAPKEQKGQEVKGQEGQNEKNEGESKRERKDIFKPNDGLCFLAPRFIRFEELNMLDIYNKVGYGKE